MTARTRFLGPSLQQLLVAVPSGLLATSVLFDFIGLLTGSPSAHGAAYWALCGGLVGALAAAPFGYLDWTAIPHGTRERRLGALHGLGSAAVLLLFLLSWLLREPGSAPTLAATLCSWAASASALATAWLGAQLLGRLRGGFVEAARHAR